MAITRADLRDRILRRLEYNTGFYEAQEIDRAINDAIRLVNLMVGLIQNSSTVSGGTVAGQSIYQVPSDILIPTAVYFDDEPLKKTTLRSMSLNHPLWMSETTAMLGFQVSEWAPVGISKFAIWPADSAGGFSLRVEGIGEPTFTNQSSESLPIDAEHAEVIEAHAVHILTAKEGGKVFLDTAVKLFRSQYRQKLQELQFWSSSIMPYLRVEVKAEKE